LLSYHADQTCVDALMW